MNGNVTSSPGSDQSRRHTVQVPAIGRQPIRRRLRAWRHRYRNQRHLEQSLRAGDELVLVHQMGKVGSSSLVRTLEAMPGVKPLQTHWCNPINVAHAAGIINERRRVSNRYGDRDHFGLMVREQIIESGAATRVITLMRDPVARNVSSYFQHLDEIWGIRRAHDRIAPRDLERGFHEAFEHDEPLDWFDSEIREVFGIDLLAHPFDRDARWDLIRTRQWSVLIMRSDLADEGKQTAMSHLLERPVPALQRANVGEDKTYAATYRAFKEQLRLPSEYLDRYYEAAVTRHFFTEAEIARLRSHWNEV